MGRDRWRRLPRPAKTLVWLASLLLVGLAATAITTGGLLLWRRWSEPFRSVARTVRLHPAVREALGTPVETGWFVASRPGEEDGKCTQLTFAVTGSRGAGRVLAEAARREKGWEITFLAVDLEGRNLRLQLETR